MLHSFPCINVAAVSMVVAATIAAGGLQLLTRQLVATGGLQLLMRQLVAAAKTKVNSNEKIQYKTNKGKLQVDLNCTGRKKKRPF